MKFSIKVRTLVGLGAVGVVLALAPMSARAVDLGMTPSHVFDLWANINNALITTGKSMDGGQALGQKMETMDAQTFQGKKPGDVLKLVEGFRSKLDKLATLKKLQRTPVFKDPAGGTVTPSVVFLNSGHVLDGILRYLIKIDENKMISAYYTRHDVNGKKPSDVYSMVELASRRIDLIK